MIEFGITLLLVALAFILVSLLDALKAIGNATVQLLDAIESHRRAQGMGVYKHAGLLTDEADE